MRAPSGFRSFRLMLASLLLPLLAPVLLTGCARPPASAYVRGGLGKAAAQVAIGKDSAGEACTMQENDATGADVYCGTGQQPSARVREGDGASVGQLGALATASPWRVAIDQRYLCQVPRSTSILGGHPAELLPCTQRLGGWPHVAMVALVNGRAWYADGLLPAAGVMERAIGVRAGILSASAVPPSSAADALLAKRLAAQAFSSGDIHKYNALMIAGTRANLADDPAAAEEAFRAALTLQRKALGTNNPNTVLPLMTLALQLSDEGRYADAKALFAEAERLAPRAADATAAARLQHYRGLDELNQSRYSEALHLLQQAAAAYESLLPQSVLHPHVARFAPATGFGAPGGGSLASMLPNQSLLTDPTSQGALLGLIEVRRNMALVLRRLHSLPESEAMLESASLLARANGVDRPIEAARLLRTRGITDESRGMVARGLTDLAASAADFGAALPGSKPFADTYLLRAAGLLEHGRTEAALPDCQQAARTLMALHVGTDPDLMEPCLDVYAAAAGRAAPAARQGLLREMFTAAQLAQGSVTSQQIAEATARLRESARDPKVAAAIRTRQDAGAHLRELYRERDQAAAAAHSGSAPTSAAALAALDKQIDAARTNLADAESAVQAAAPNFAQLVQQVVSAKSVFSELHPHEAFAQITLGAEHGWVFLLRHGQIAIARVPGGLPAMAKLVKQVRGGIELTSTSLPVFNVAAARTLYSDTLGGVAKDMVGVENLVVAPAGPLLSLPFEVLLTGPAKPDDLANAPWLVRKFAIAHVPAAANFVSLRKVAGTSRAKEPWFGFGDFQPLTLAQAQASFPGAACGDTAQLLAGLPALPYAGKELGAARELLHASRADELLGANFTVPAVLHANLKNFRILHFATHALLPAELRCQSQPAIVTSDPAGAGNATDALLTASDVMGMHLDANLVILSACNSGGPGGETAGESLSGLARAFFFAGARALMVTHWSVNDQVTAYLIADTLRRMQAHPALGVAGALRKAQLAMLAAAGHSGLPSEVAHPFFWAPFAVIGDGGERPAATAARVPWPARRAG
jgi:CHAT domain-containing protein/tetratricopeptide (TPR) repeat protein